MARTNANSATVLLVVAAAFLVGGARAINVPVVGVLGTAASISANTETTIEFAAGPTLVIEADAAAQVTLSLYANLDIALPTGFTALSFGANAGYTLAMTGGGLVSARLTTPSLTAAASGAITGTVKAQCFRFDVDAQAWVALAVPGYDGEGAFSVDLPKVGSYAFVRAAATVPLPAIYLEARATTSTSTKLSFPGGFELDVATETDNEVTIGNPGSSPHKDPQGKMNIGTFFDIELENEEDVEAELRFKYDAGISAAVASTLRFAYWDESGGEGEGDGEWVFPESGGSVDTSARVVSQTTTHFSQWGVYGNRQGDSLMSKSNVGLNPFSPRKCYSVDNEWDIGSLEFEVTKVDGSATVRAYIIYGGDDCPTNSNHDIKGSALDEDGEKETLCVDNDSTPPLNEGRYWIQVFGEGLTTGTTRFSLEVSRGLGCSGAAAAAPMALVALVGLAAAVVGRSLADN